MTGPSSCLRTFLLALDFLFLDPSVPSELRWLTSQVVTLGSSSMTFLTLQAEAKRKKRKASLQGHARNTGIGAEVTSDLGRKYV